MLSSHSNSTILLSLYYFLTPQFQTFTNLPFEIFGVSNSSSSLLNLQTIQAPLFRLFTLPPTPLQKEKNFHAAVPQNKQKNWVFQWTPILNILIINPIPS